MLIPFLSYFADGQTVIVGEGVTTLIRDMSPEQIFTHYARHIGIGGIAMAGIIGIIKSSGIIKQALGLAVKELGGKKGSGEMAERTQRDLSMKFILTGLLATLITTFIFFHFGVLGNLFQTIVAILIVFIISFLIYYCCCECNSYRGNKPGVRNDFNDVDFGFFGTGECRIERY